MQNVHPYSYDGSDVGVLILHGFTGTPDTLYPLIQDMRERGYTVSAPLLSGHGTTLEDMEHYRDTHWIKDTQDAASALRSTCRHVVAAGLSMGGCLSLILAARGLVDGVVSVNAPIRIWDGRARFAALVSPFMRYNKWTPPERPDGYLVERSLEYDASPVRCVPSLNRIMKLAERGLPDIRCPLLAVQSKADETVKPISGQMIYDRASSSDKELLWLERSAHVSTLDLERERIHERAAALVERVAAG